MWCVPNRRQREPSRSCNFCPVPGHTRECLLLLRLPSDETHTFSLNAMGSHEWLVVAGSVSSGGGGATFAHFPHASG